jgi:hypothetical protein
MSDRSNFVVLSIEILLKSLAQRRLRKKSSNKIPRPGNIEERCGGDAIAAFS